MQYKYKKSKEKVKKNPESKMQVVVEKAGENNNDDTGSIRLAAQEPTAEEKAKRARKSAAFSVLILVIVAIVCGFILYTNNYYHTEEYPDRIPENVDIQTLDNGSLAFVPDHPIAGFVFYPGGKVEFSAYEQLMLDCADDGILCILVKMPFNLAFFDSDAADYCMEQYPNIKNWYIGGHSLGGVAASGYAAKNADKLRGLILLASYSPNDLTDSGLSVLSVYGSNDGVLNMKSYEKSFSNLPYDTTEVIIDGGCHSYFGNYGMQKGDGTPAISRDEQIDETVSAIRSRVLSDINIDLS